jgi:putative ABC transport system permease protein
MDAAGQRQRIMTIYREVISMALETILAHKLRSFLTILGIVVGIMTVILIASILTGMRQSIIAMAKDYGTDNIFVFHLNTGIQISRRSREEMRRKPLTVEDAQAIKDLCSAVKDVSWQILPFSSRVQIQYKGDSLRNYNFSGVPSNYANVANVKVENGRFFTSSEDRHRMPVVILGPDSAESLFAQSDPLGKKILINGHLFTVLGVTEKSKSGVLSSDVDSSVIIPHRTFRKIMPWEDKYVLFIQAKPEMRSTALDETEGLLRLRRGVKPKDPNNFDLTTADRFIEQFDSITSTVGLIVIAISGVGLLVGGIGVMNIMLVSVTERTREIGVRKAVGATKLDIVIQFLFEAITLTGVGGVFGIILAITLSYIVISFIPDLPAAIPLWAVLTGLCVSVGIGLVFGVWPAQKAARLDPIEALRHE